MIFILKPKHWLLLLTGGKVSRKSCSKKPWYLKEPGMSSGRSLCTRSLGSLSSLQQIPFHHVGKSSAAVADVANIKQNTATIDDNFSKICQQLLPLKQGKYCNCACSAGSITLQGPGLSSGIHLQPSKAETAKQSLEYDPAALLCRICQTRKWSKRPSAKRAPGRHPGLFQISRLFGASFPADVSPGQKEQPMFWFKINITLFQRNRQ